MRRRSRRDRYPLVTRPSVVCARLVAAGVTPDAAITTVRIHRKYALHEDPESIALYYGVTLAAVELALESFAFSDWIGRQRCTICGEAPGERDRGVLTRYRGGFACHRCIQGAETSDADWYDFIKLLLDEVDDQRDGMN